MTQRESFQAKRRREHKRRLDLARRSRAERAQVIAQFTREGFSRTQAILMALGA